MVGGKPSRHDARGPVELEQVAPDLAGGVGGRPERLEDPDVARGAPGLELLVDAVQRVTRGTAVELEQSANERAARLVRLRAQPAVLPPVARAAHHSRPLGPHSVVECGKALEGLLGGDDPDLAAPAIGDCKRGPLPRHVDLAAERREPVAEASVDGRLRGPERRERLVSRARVVELATHHRGEDPPAAMRRQHAHDRHSRRGNRAAGDGHLERERPGRRDDRLPVGRDEHPVDREELREALRVLLGGFPAEEVSDRAEPLAELGLVGRGTDVDRHQMRSSGA